MGMDVYGKNPISENGSYFRNTVTAWPPLAKYCMEVAPEITKDCKYWYSNDGDGLDADGACALAKKLQAEIDVGRTLQYMERYARAQKKMPKKPCKYCDGTGLREPVPFFSFNVENVQGFINFLKDSGGFVIW